jgi:hypothetical protein
MFKKWRYSLALIVGGITVLLADNHTPIPWLWGFELGSVAGAIRLGMLLLAAPGYFFSVGIGGGVVLYVARIFVDEGYVNFALPYVFIVYQIMGYVWIFAKALSTVKSHSEEAANRNEEVEGKRVERKREESKKRWLANAPERLERERRREEEATLERARREELGSKFATLIESLDRPLVETLRTGNALHGWAAPVSSRKLIEVDVVRILRCLSVANGVIPNEFACQYLAILARLEPSAQLTVEDCIARIEVANAPLALPFAVQAISYYDQMSGTQLAAEAANTYWALILASSEYCERSLATDTVRAQYQNVLQPYISNDSTGKGIPSSNNQGRGLFNGNCQDCRKYYAVLQIPGDASEQAIEMAHKDLRVIYHPDRFQNNERLRQKSEEHFKKIEQAYTHIMKHFSAERR